MDGCAAAPAARELDLTRPSILYVAVLLTCTGVLATACSGAETQDVLVGSSASSTSSSSSSGSSGTSSSSSGTTSSGTSGTSGSTDTCPEEEEPNDDKDEANVLAPVRCGTLSDRRDREFLTFQLEPDTESMSINFTGRVRLRVDVPGHDTTELTPDNSEKVPFVIGADYLVEVRSLTDSNAPVKWRVELVEK